MPPPPTARVPIASYAQLLLISVGALIAVIVTCPFVAIYRLLTCYYCRHPDGQRATKSACACCYTRSRPAAIHVCSDDASVPSSCQTSTTILPTKAHEQA